MSVGTYPSPPAQTHTFPWLRRYGNLGREKGPDQQRCSEDDPQKSWDRRFFEQTRLVLSEPLSPNSVFLYFFHLSTLLVRYSVAQSFPTLCDRMDCSTPSFPVLLVHPKPSGEGNGNPLQCSCLENPRDEGAWWAAVYGVAQSRTRLK